MRRRWLIFIDVISVVFGVGARVWHRLSDHARSMQISIGGRSAASQMREMDEPPSLPVAPNSFNLYPLSLTQTNLTHILFPTGLGWWLDPGLLASYCTALKQGQGPRKTAAPLAL